MNIIKVGNSYKIYGEEDLKTLSKLDPLVYNVQFSQMEGYSLASTNSFLRNDGKIYGTQKEKVRKVYQSFSLTDQSLGVILSGDKGMGKTLFVRLLAKKMLSEGYPVILVNNATPGLPNFLDSIKQESLVVFDEFEKNFNDDEQNSLLSFFDGSSNSKKLYALTVNKLYSLSEFILNRPGRFHYHIQFAYPSEGEIKEYLHDKLNEKYYSQIPAVVSFSKRTFTNFDALKALVFELNQGYSFKEAIGDLNLLRVELPTYDIRWSAKGKIGKKYVYYRQVQLDLADDVTGISFGSMKSDYPDLDVEFYSKDIQNSLNGSMVVPSDKVTITEIDYDEDEYKDSTKESDYRPGDLTISLHPKNNPHY